MTQLKLTVLDAQDLEVISTHLQDAIVRVGDMTYLQNEKRFVLVANRFDWETADKTKNKTLRRCFSGVHFEAVKAVRTKNISNTQEDVILELLSIDFTTGVKPSGKICLKFAAGGEIELDVEYIEALMKDLGGAWEAQSRPDHGDENG